MRYPRESRRGWRWSSARSILVAAVGIVALNGAAAAQTDVAAGPQPFTFRKSVVPNGAYLTRIIDATLDRRAAPRADVPLALDVAVTPPEPEDSASLYARRYGISRDLARTILDIAVAEGVDPDLGFRLVRTESRFKTTAVGPAGALGLTQLMPSTARYVDRSVRTRDQILEPATNLRLGFRYLKGMIERYDGDVRLGLLAYNRGEVAVNRALRSGRDPENGYSHKVLGTRGKNPYRGQGLLARVTP